MTFDLKPLAASVHAAAIEAPRPVPTKACAKCKKDKAEGAFYKASRSSDGLQSYCIECTKKVSAESSAKRAEKRRRSEAARRGALKRWGKAKESAPDPVNNPSHYQQGGIECIDAMVQVFGEDAVRTYARINAFKYQWRAPYKGKTAEDYEKALWYLRFAAGDDPRKDRADG
jgi:hypothetical protein